MSVTFSIEGNFTGAFTAHCYDLDLTLGPVDGHEAILPLLDAHKAECEECAHYGIYSQAVLDVDDTLDLNVSNLNARTLLIALGLDDGDDLCGTLDGEDFLGRVLLALATDRDDSGVPYAIVGGAEVGQSGATVVDCGRSVGYFADRFGALHALALKAVRLGRGVVWS
jgi:hypothetical protein